MVRCTHNSKVTTENLANLLAGKDLRGTPKFFFFS
jgi:hypothetical protein